MTKLHSILLDSTEAVTKRFAMVPITGITQEVPVRSLLLYEILIEFCEQLAEDDLVGRSCNYKDILEEILVNLPCIKIK